MSVWLLTLTAPWELHVCQNDQTVITPTSNIYICNQINDISQTPINAKLNSMTSILFVPWYLKFNLRNTTTDGFYVFNYCLEHICFSDANVFKLNVS